MVRDDFWVPLSRFMEELNIRLIPGESSSLVDLFDLRHAKKVLTAFGRAYGVLPDERGSPSRDQVCFLNQAIEGLAQDGRVISIRLALFAEMVKGKAWTPATLREVGGMQGVGITFLEETFSSAATRRHLKAAQAVLKALLPGSGTSIKGHMRSHEELLEASGYASRPKEFDDLLRILDSEMRLITPTDPEGIDTEGGQGPTGGRYYQLTHDYLVTSLREWLTRKLKETRRGRAELRLAERAALWNAMPVNRHLPTIWEVVNILALTRRKDWTETQRRMMRKVERWNLVRLGLILMCYLLLMFATSEIYQYSQAPALVERLKNAEIEEVPSIVNKISSHRRWADPKLTRLLASSEPSSAGYFHASLALLPVDSGQVDYLFQRMLTAEPGELVVIRAALAPHRAKLTPKLWSLMDLADAEIKHLNAMHENDRAPG